MPQRADDRHLAILRDDETGLLTPYNLGDRVFGLLGGVVMLAEIVPAGTSGPELNEVLRGKALIRTGSISGKEAYAEIVILPLAIAGRVTPATPYLRSADVG